MLKPSLLTSVVALSLYGCAGGQQLNVTEIEQLIAQQTMEICKFEPVLATLAGIIGAAAGQPIPVVVSQIATAICQTIPAATVKRKAGGPEVRIIVGPDGKQYVIKGYGIK